MIKYDFSLLVQPEDKQVGIPEDSDLWLPARLGRITASKRAHTLITGRDKAIALMMDEMANELGTEPTHFSNKYTEHGHAFENQAISEYDMMRLGLGEIVRKPGLYVHPQYDIASATPDFFEGGDTTGQVKCPYYEKNHLALLHFGITPKPKSGVPGHPQYYTQVQFESFVTGRPNIVFISYHPEVPVKNQLYVEEVKLDTEMHDKFAAKLEKIHHMLVNDERPIDPDEPLGVDGIPDLF